MSKTPFAFVALDGLPHEEPETKSYVVYQTRYFTNDGHGNMIEVELDSNEWARIVKQLEEVPNLQIMCAGNHEGDAFKPEVPWDKVMGLFLLAAFCLFWAWMFLRKDKSN